MNNLDSELKAYKIRKYAIDAVHAAKSGHPGGSLSISDILSILYFEQMNVDPKNPAWADRDRLVLSKGHCAPALYGALAEAGFIPAEDITGFRNISSYLQGHPVIKVPGVDMATGSLGQGVCVAGGMALAAKLDNKDYRVYTVTGDGELEEGQVWEAAMFAAHYKLDNLTLFVDHNGLQIDGDITAVMNPNPVADKYAAFGWHVISVDGHDIAAISDAVEEAKTLKGKPTCIVCETVKGKGVSFMENKAGWHGTAPKEDEYKLAMAELDKAIEELEVEVNG